jgi:hypothetical protein
MSPTLPFHSFFCLFPENLWCVNYRTEPHQIQCIFKYIAIHPDIPQAVAWRAAFDTQGYYEWKTTVAGNQVVGKTYPEDIEEFANWDTSIVWDRFPPATDVLTLHGLSDATVPP